ncbi:MAG: tRNA pseudouridine(55) synthase TruB [Acidimicrobiia bacterium]|nr:tRNA pseudouridine(55) synthase TruB [Acidimicrobiia bacterium]NNC74586.1 tRNA pseudouridine(55) synthase TruB [Acidimicrobiia bacterium]
MIGFLLVDKPQGWTSHDVVAKVRGATRIKKVGHAGTLDPMATGLLVVAIGRATRLLRFVQGLPKTYLAHAVLGVATDTLDADGAVLERSPLPVGQDDVESVLDRFRGPILQVPPMVSAIKVGGQRLYEMARRGEEIEREARPVTIHQLDVIDFAPSDYPELAFRVVCSTGTYVRTLADDIGRALGGRAHLDGLRRTSIGSLSVEDSHSIDSIAVAGEATEALLVDPADALADLPSLVVAENVAEGVRHGVALARSSFPDLDDDSHVRVLDEAGRLLAVCKANGGSIKPEVVLG